MTDKIITIVGGSGFLGRYVVRALAKAGYRVRIIVRNPDLAAPLKTAGDVGQISIESGNLAVPETLIGKIEGSKAVINLVGILFESGRQNFTNLHAQGAEKLAQMAKSAGVLRYVHMSSLGVEKASGSNYARSKILGERAVRAAFPEATIFRPSVIFGPEDNFFNQFATMANLSCILPAIGGGRTKFQPVYVGDVAHAIEVCLARSDTKGQTYELGGPQIFSFREILEYILKTTSKDRKLVSLPFAAASAIAPLAQYLPPPFSFTADQVRLLKYDNIVSHDVKTFADLGITPTAVEMVVPEYLARFRKKKAA